MSTDPITGLNAALEGRYCIERELGEGGMATVYLAKDLKHNRNVALKVMKPELAAVVGAERFLAEIETTANLQHPHILPLFDSGEAHSFLFYVMPYVEGETLQQRLEVERRLNVEEAVRIASDVAEALQAAHEAGVIHRDVKPANILLSRGRALVADFGVARVAASGVDRITQTGMSIGTAGYMSPEQAMGERDVDHRADTYSLGCVLYEMLAGELPYSAPTLMGILTRQATEPVPSVRKVRPEVSDSLDRAVARALASDRADRFATVSAFAAAFAVDSSVGLDTHEQPKAVVILPFVNRSGDAENEYFSDGLTEEVIADLSGIPALRVISRNSAMALKGTTKDTTTLARELHVSHLVTGAVRRAGNALRVTAELVDAATDSPIWSGKYSGTVEDVFGIQEEISGKIVAALQVTLTDARTHGAHERPIDNVVAYDCYLRARRESYSWTPDSSRRAHRLIDEALTIVGDNPLLLATKGQLYYTEVNVGGVPADVALPKAAEYAARALAIDPDHPLGVFLRGLIAALRGNPEEALPELRRAHELWPGDANVIGELCRFSITAGVPTIEGLVNHLVEIDPLTAVSHLVVSLFGCVNGRYDRVGAAARRASALCADDSALHLYSAWYMAEAGHREEASELLGRTANAMGGTPLAEWALVLKFTLDGDFPGALRHLTADVEGSIQNETGARFMADVFALMGRRNDALRWLRVAIARGYTSYPSLAVHDTFLDNLRSDLDFEALMADLKPRWEALVADGGCESHLLAMTAHPTSYPKTAR